MRWERCGSRAEGRYPAGISISGTPDDRELVAAAQGGDRNALDSLLRRHYDRLYAVCRRLTGDDADAADACQEGLMAIVRGLPRFDARAAFGTWAYRVVTNAALDELRRRRRRPDPGLPEETAGSANPAAAAAGTDHAAETAARLDVDAALATLSPEFRAAVVLRDLCGLSYEEIAEALDIPPGTVRSRIARARGALGPLLAGDGNPPPPHRRPSEQR
ncbi:MAG: RNA polymerase sigma factor [Actinobacteria bacterium]|nr:RNA polymerase sigma factor [Actinomycetota bacterium]